MARKRTLPPSKGTPSPTGAPEGTDTPSWGRAPGDVAAAGKRIGETAHEQRYALRRAVESVKAAVPLVEYAGGLTRLRRSGGTFVGRCPIPDHEDKTPSFTVWPLSASRHGSWWCFGCGRGSDVIDLYYHLHGCTGTWEAIVGLSLERGVDLPGRSEAWHRATHRKVQYRNVAYRVLGNVLKRRMYKTLILPYIDLIEDPEEHERELERSWREWAGWRGWPCLAEELAGRNEDALRALAAANFDADRAVSEAARERGPGL